VTKVGRFEGGGAEFWGVLVEQSVRPLAGTFEDWAPALADGSEVGYDGPPVALSELRPLAPVTPNARLVCFGGTYREHMRRMEQVLGAATDDPGRAPGAFLKPVSAIIDPDADIAYPPTTRQLDYEVEIVVVIGRPLAGDPAGAAILGYTIGNDVSARDAKNRTGGSDFFAMKALDGTSPLGPWITLKDELGLTPDVELRLSVNGELRQQDRTASLMWSFEALLDHVNARLAVRPGDLIWTGTPAGVAWEGDSYLEPGDVVEASIEGIGTLCNRVGPRPVMAP
jgi:2-keto-4-pentenoate hydratase/2-oxohepta-3-ene-1,7-dioic acid hydratase in catechol pathway